MSDSVVPDTVIWGLRSTSAVLSYVGFVAYFDRPQGTLQTQLDSDIRIQPSTVPKAGLGLFAARNLPKGTILGNYPGVVLPLTQNLGKVNDHPYCETYIWRFSDSKYLIDPTDSCGKLQDYSKGGNYGMPGSCFLMEQILPFRVSTALCRINEPPIGKDVNVVTEEDLQARTVTFLLERDVVEGEEFFIDYGLTYDRSMYGGGSSSNS